MPNDVPHDEPSIAVVEDRLRIGELAVEHLFDVEGIVDRVGRVDHVARRRRLDRGRRADEGDVRALERLRDRRSVMQEQAKTVATGTAANAPAARSGQKGANGPGCHHGRRTPAMARRVASADPAYHPHHDQPDRYRAARPMRRSHTCASMTPSTSRSSTSSSRSSPSRADPERAGEVRRTAEWIVGGDDAHRRRARDDSRDRATTRS